MMVLVLVLLLLLVRSHEAEALQLLHNQPATLLRYVCVRLEKRAGPLRGPPFPALPASLPVYCHSVIVGGTAAHSPVYKYLCPPILVKIKVVQAEKETGLFLVALSLPLGAILEQTHPLSFASERHVIPGGFSLFRSLSFIRCLFFFFFLFL